MRATIEHAAHGLIGEIDTKRLSAHRDCHPVDDNIDLHLSGSRQVIPECLVHADVCLLRRSGRAVVLEPAAEFIGFADVVHEPLPCRKAETGKGPPAEER